MPQMTLYESRYIETAAELDDLLALLRKEKIVTSAHAQTIAHAVTPLLPCQLKVAARTPRSIIYCDAGGRMFRVGQRGEFMPGAWSAGRYNMAFW